MNADLTKKQFQQIHRLARDECCNCINGDCLLLDDGDSHRCVQLNSCGIACYYFLKAVLPSNSKLHKAVILKLI